MRSDQVDKENGRRQQWLSAQAELGAMQLRLPAGREDSSCKEENMRKKDRIEPHSSELWGQSHLLPSCGSSVRSWGLGA